MDRFLKAHRSIFKKYRVAKAYSYILGHVNVPLHILIRITTHNDDCIHACTPRNGLDSFLSKTVSKGCTECVCLPLPGSHTYMGNYTYMYGEHAPVSFTPWQPNGLMSVGESMTRYVHAWTNTYRDALSSSAYSTIT